MTGAQKCSHVDGMACELGSGAYVWMHSAARAALMACELGSGAYVWMHSAARAAFVYSRGDCSAILGDLRGSDALWSMVGSFIGGGASVGAGRVVGVSVCVLVGGTFRRVCR